MSNTHTQTKTKADMALECVHNLYHLQLTLLDLIEGDLRDPKVRREARQQARTFVELLENADWRYMGGEDVLDSLKQLPTELEQKLKSSPVAVARAKRHATRRK